MSARNQDVRRGRCTRIIFASTLVCGAFASLHWVARAAADESLTIARVSVDSTGTQADGESLGAAISADGRRIAFVSWATNVAPNDTNGFGDVFVKDRETGATLRVSVASSGAQANGESYEPAISADGRYVAFTSEASNLVMGDTDRVADVFVRDMTSGTTLRASLATDGHQGDAASSAATISGDGRYLAFESAATNLVSGDSNKQVDVFVRDFQAGTTQRISVSASGVEGNGTSQSAALSDDGGYVAFASTAGNLVSPPDENTAWDVFVKDRSTGSVIRASVSSAGSEGNGNSSAPSISADGHLVAFESQATDLVAGDTNARSDVFLRDLAAATTTRISLGLAGAQANGANTHPSISADGRYIAFTSEASNLVPDDTNGEQDAFVYDRQSGSTTRVSVGPLGVQGQGPALWAALSRDGRYVAFPSGAQQLNAGDSNGAVDVFLRGPLF